MASDRRAAGALGALLLIPLVLGVSVAFVALSRSPLESATSAGPLFGAVVHATRADTATAGVTVIQPEEFGVETQSSGIVTALTISVGEPIANGSVAMEVSGTPVVAYVSPAPLYRDIARGLEGPDVATAQALLVALGYLDRADGVAGWATSRAISGFNSDHGRKGDGATLRTSSLVWIPDDSSAPTKVTIRVGARLEPGLEVYRAVSGPPSVTLSMEPSSTDRIVTVEGTSVALAAGEATIRDPEDVAALVKALRGESSGSASVSLAQPRSVGMLPATAVVTDDAGRTCFFGDLSGKGLIIDATQGWLGQVDVDASLVGTTVLLNPRQVREDLSCGS